MTADPAPLLKAQDVMNILGCSRSFLTDHRAELGGIRVGSKLMFRRADLDAYLDRQRIAEPPAEAPAPTPIRRPAPIGRGPTNPVTQAAWGAPPAATRTRRPG